MHLVAILKIKLLYKNARYERLYNSGQVFRDSTLTQNVNSTALTKLVKKFPTLSETRRFTTVFTTVELLPLSQPDKTSPYNATRLRVILI